MQGEMGNTGSQGDRGLPGSGGPAGTPGPAGEPGPAGSGAGGLVSWNECAWRDLNVGLDYGLITVS